MPTRFPRFTALLLLLVSALPGIGRTTLQAQSTPPAPSYSARRPHLIVVISIDQFRYDYLERFAPWFSAGGFNRFLKQGADFDHAFYRHAITFTGPGHAAIGTGRNPAETGIVGNTWLERNAPFDQRSWDWLFEDTGGYKAASHPVAPAGMPAWYAHGGVPRYCVDDPRTRVSEGRTDGMSPVALDGDSLGDRLKQKYPDAHVVATALKDRAAILMAGRRADAAYWFDHKLPGFVSSGYYRYDRSLLDFNSRVKSYFPESGLWKLSGIIPTADMQRITFDPPEAWPLKNQLYGGTFDHPVKSGRAFAYSPFANDMLLDFTSAAIVHHHLGEDSSPDLLFIGISTPDYIGHYYGPDSMEVADDAVRLDRSLERFLNALEAKFGDGLLVAITADHGVQSRPEIARLRDPKIDAGRTDLRNAVRTAHFISELPPLRIELERQVAKKLEIPFNVGAPLSQALLFFFEEPSLYLNWERISELKLDGERVKRAFRDVLLSMPASGIDHVFTNTELLAATAPKSEIERQVRVSFRADRSGELLVTLRKNWIWNANPSNTTHGQPLPDDQHVPLLLWGSGIKAGHYAERVAPTDLARTLGAIVGVEAAGSDTHVLPCLIPSASAAASLSDADLRTILTAALATLDAETPHKFVVSDSIDDRTRAVLATLRPVIDRETLPETDEATLLEGYARLDKVVVEGDTASVTIWSGPIPKPRPNVMIMACGTGRTVRFHRDAAGVWTMDAGMSVIMC